MLAMRFTHAMCFMRATSFMRATRFTCTTRNTRNPFPLYQGNNTLSLPNVVTSLFAFAKAWSVGFKKNRTILPPFKWLEPQCLR